MNNMNHVLQGKNILTMPIKTLEERFKLARDTLLKFIEQDIIKENTTEEGTAEKKSIEEDTKSREIVVLSGISLEGFRKLYTEARKFKIYIRLVKGEVIIYEVPSPAHSFTVGHLCYLVRTWSSYLNVGVALDMTVSYNTEYISDVVVEPVHPQPLKPGSVSQPRMIIEVGRHESIGSLHSLAREYFSASTQTNFMQVYLSIKIYPRRSNGTATMV